MKVRQRLHTPYHNDETKRAIAFGMALLTQLSQRNATLTTIFGNYLFLDILVCTLPRLITLSFLPAFRDQICSVDSIYAWLQSQTASETLLISERGLMAQDLLSQCGDVVVVLQVVMVLWLLLATAVHVVLAIRVGRFARYLREEDVKAGERKLVVWQKKQAMATKEPEEEVLKKRIDMV
jgi:beta-lactamase regulating signal transducer with metallopeptidase domain